jgi:hypothetical protein
MLIATTDKLIREGLAKSPFLLDDHIILFDPIKKLHKITDAGLVYLPSITLIIGYQHKEETITTNRVVGLPQDVITDFVKKCKTLYYELCLSIHKARDEGELPEEEVYVNMSAIFTSLQGFIIEIVDLVKQQIFGNYTYEELPRNPSYEEVKAIMAATTKSEKKSGVNHA